MSGSFVDRYLATETQPQATAPVAPKQVEQGPSFLDRFLGAVPAVTSKGDVETRAKAQWGIPEPAAAAGEVGGPMPQQLFPDNRPAPSHAISGPSGSWVKDAARFAGTAGANLLAGLGSLPNLAAQGIDYAGSLAGADLGTKRAIESARGPANKPIFSDFETAKDTIYNATRGTEYQPESWAGRRALDAATGLAGGVTGPARALLPGAVGAAVGGEAVERFPGSPLAAALIGNTLGAYGAGAIGNRFLPRAGGTLPLEEARLAQSALRDYDIPLGAGQLSNNRLVRFLTSEGGRWPMSGADKFAENQRSSWNRAVLKQAGIDADVSTPEALSQNRARIGAVMDDVANRTTIPMNNTFLQELQDVIDHAKMNSGADVPPAVERQAMNIINTAAQNGGNISGEAYQSLTRFGTPLSDMARSPDPNIKHYGVRLREVLDDNLQRNAHPDDLAALKQARREWKAEATIEPLTVRGDVVGGARASTGDIDPIALRQAVNKSYTNAARADIGDVPLNDLARIGQRFLKEPPDSGTGQRNLINQGIRGVGGEIAALAAALATTQQTGVPLGVTIAGTTAGLGGAMGVNRLAQSLLRSRTLAERAIESSMNPNGFQFAMPRLSSAAVTGNAISNDRAPPPLRISPQR